MNKVNITEVVLRDAHQCLLATRMRTEDMLPICDKLDKVGYWALEMWGGATFDTCIRFLKEDPWARLRQLRTALPNSQLSMLLRGQNIVGYRHYADDVVNRFCALAANNGIDVFRIFDALNDIRNLQIAIAAVKKAGKHAQGTISYTTSPVHTLDQFVDMAVEMQALGCDSIAIKDMAGILVPKAAAELVQALKVKLSVPIHLHTHATSGVAALCHMAAIEQGCVHIDTAISSLSEGASHTCTESMVIALQDTNYDTGLDLSLLQEIAEHFAFVRKKYHQFESDATRTDPRVFIYQIPGGMISNLTNQLQEQNALDKLPQVHDEIPRVRKDLGYPPLVTPTSQVVATQAVINVLTGERYKTVTNEVKLYCQHKYGKPPAEIDPKVRQLAIGNAEVIDCRPAELLKSEFAAKEKEIGDLAQSEEDIISYILFPDISREFFQQRAAGQLMPEPLENPHQQAQAVPTEFIVSLHGEDYHIDLTGMGHHRQNKRPYYLTVDGIPEEVLVQVMQQTENQGEDNSDAAKAPLSASNRPKPSNPGDITVAMPSTVIEVSVSVGDRVSAGDALLITEAMKMETTIQATISGTVKDIYVTKGDSIHPDETLMIITP